MLETVQQASLRIGSRGEFKRCNRQLNAEQLRTTCVCTSSPVTMFPTARRAALVTLFCWCLITGVIFVTITYTIAILHTTYIAIHHLLL